MFTFEWRSGQRECHIKGCEGFPFMRFRTATASATTTAATAYMGSDVCDWCDQDDCGDEFATAMTTVWLPRTGGQGPLLRDIAVLLDR